MNCRKEVKFLTFLMVIGIKFFIQLCLAHCTWVGIPENECCPVCLGCQTDGEKRKKNETWQKDDCTRYTLLIFYAMV